MADCIHVYTKTDLNQADCSTGIAVVPTPKTFLAVTSFQSEHNEGVCLESNTA